MSVLEVVGGDVKAAMSTVQQKVDESFATAQQYADGAYSKLESILTQLQTELGNLAPATITATPSEYSESIPITVEDLSGINFDAILDAVNTILEDIEELAKPAIPTLLTLPPLEIDFQKPPSPGEAPVINIPNTPDPFNGNPPTPPDLDELAEDIEEDFAALIAVIQQIRSDMAGYRLDPVYWTPELEALQLKLAELRETGGEALSNEVRQNELLYDQQARDDAISDLINKTGNGFSLPSGFLLANIAAIEKEYTAKRMVAFNEMAKLELQLKHQTQTAALQVSAQLEGQLMDYRVKAAGVMIELSKAIIQVVQAVMDARLKLLNAYIAIYQAQVEAFKAEIQVKLAEYQLFDAQIKGEVAKVQLYGEKVNVYGKQIEAEKLAMTAELEEFKAVVEGNEMLLKQAGLEVERYKAIIGAYDTLMNAYLKDAQIQNEIFKGELELAKIKAQLEIQLAENAARASLMEKEIAMKENEVILQDASRKLSAYMELKRGIIASLSQLVASALSSIHVQTSLGASGQAQEQYNMNHVYHDPNGIQKSESRTGKL